jgi:ATP-dependent helicase/nuclease subunit B
LVQRLYRGPLRTSVSELETQAACPFQRFARHVLRLSERAEAVLEPVDVGQVHHAILEDFIDTLSKREQRLAQLSDSELVDGLHESCARVATRLPPSGVLSNARSAYRLRRSAADLARVIRAQRHLSRSGAAGPRATELPFGFDRPGGLPAMELSTPAGRRVLLRGYIDRVDLVELSDELLGIVIDYKRTPNKRLDLQEVYHGLSLQLLAYLLVLAEKGRTLAGRPIRPVRPVGALYVSLASQYHTVDRPDLLSARDGSLAGTHRPRGLLAADGFAALDTSTEAGWSESYSVYRNKDGNIGHIDTTDAADADTFQMLLDHTRGKLGELADEILDGNVTVNPYRLGTLSPCTWCPLPAVCRFEIGISEVRFLESLRRSQVFQKLSGRSS